MTIKTEEEIKRAIKKFRAAETKNKDNITSLIAYGGRKALEWVLNKH